MSCPLLRDLRLTTQAQRSHDRGARQTDLSSDAQVRDLTAPDRVVQRVPPNPEQFRALSYREDVVCVVGSHKARSVVPANSEWLGCGVNSIILRQSTKVISSPEPPTVDRGSVSADQTHRVQNPDRRGCPKGYENEAFTNGMLLSAEMLTAARIELIGRLLDKAAAAATELC
jgi:hypothetical protein